MAMANIDTEASPTRQQRRRRKNARERREQQTRSMARAFQTVASALTNVASHRGGKLRSIGQQWHSHILAPDARSVPIPCFRAGRTTSSCAFADVQLRACLTAASSRIASLEDDPFDGTRGVSGANSTSESEDCSSDDTANQPSDEGGIVSQLAEPEPDDNVEPQQSSSMSRACRKAASHTGACGIGRITPGTADADCEASDSDNSSDLEEARRARSKEFDRHMEVVQAKSRLRTAAFNRSLQEEKNEKVDACTFSIGNVIRPLLVYADEEVYLSGAICQVVAPDSDAAAAAAATAAAEAIGMTCVSYFEPNGQLSSKTRFVCTEHFEFACDATVFEREPRLQHSTWEAVLNANTADRD